MYSLFYANLHFCQLWKWVVYTPTWLIDLIDQFSNTNQLMSLANRTLIDLSLIDYFD